MTTEVKNAIKKIKAAGLTENEAEELACWFAQSVANRICEVEGLSDKDFDKSVDEIKKDLFKRKRN